MRSEDENKPDSNQGDWADETVQGPSDESKESVDKTVIDDSDETILEKDSLNTDHRSQTTPSQIGKYEIIRTLGKGGMGMVYLARDPGLQREVALKTMIAGEDASEEAISRFMAEARSAGKLQHPNIVGVHEVGEERALHYLVMDYIEGFSLKELMALSKGERESHTPASGHPSQEGNRELTPRRSAEIIRDIAAALHYAHENGIIHRDLKPGNIMLKEDGTVYLTDFGLARDIASDSSLTKTGQVMGTPTYLNPEQADDSRKVDARSDVYSLGAVFYHMLTGETPVKGENLMNIIYQALEREPERPTKVNPKIARDLEIICQTAMFKEPDRRYQTAQELADDLTRYLDGEPISARPASVLYRIGKKVRKYRAEVLIALVISVIGVGIFYGWYFLQQKGQLRREQDLEKQRNEAEKGKAELSARIAKEEKREWVTVYEQDFEGVADLGPEWKVGERVLVRNGALLLDSIGGRAMASLKVTIIGDAWRIAFDGWIDEKTDIVNEISIIAKLDLRESRPWDTGFGIQYGTKNNTEYICTRKGVLLEAEKRTKFLSPGVRRRFVMQYEKGRLNYSVFEPEQDTPVFEKTYAADDIEVPEDAQVQRFWTGRSQINIDNIEISRLGTPAKKTDADVADQLFAEFGNDTAIEYLLNRVGPGASRAENKMYLIKALKYNLKMPLDEDSPMRAQILAEFGLAFPDSLPSEILAGQVLYEFFSIYSSAKPCLDNEEGRARTDKAIEKDKEFEVYSRWIGTKNELNDAWQEFKNGNSHKALAALKPILKDRTISEDLLRETVTSMVAIYRDIEDYEAVVKLLAETVTRYPQYRTMYGELMLEQGMRLKRDKKSDGAFECLSEITKQTGIDPAVIARAYLELAFLYRSRGDLGATQAAFRKARAESPRMSAFACYRIVENYFGWEVNEIGSSPDEYIFWQKEGLEKGDYLPWDFAKNIGYGYTLKGDLAMAKKWYDDALKMNPTPTNYHFRGMLYLQLGDLAMGIRDLQKSIDLAEHSWTGSQLVGALMQNQEWDRAARTEVRPDYPYHKLVIERAMTLVHMNRHAEALEHLEKHLKRTDSRAAIQLAIARVHMARGEEESYVQILDGLAGNKAADVLAGVHAELKGDFTRALELYKKTDKPYLAFFLDNTDSEVRARLAANIGSANKNPHWLFRKAVAMLLTGMGDDLDVWDTGDPKDLHKFAWRYHWGWYGEEFKYVKARYLEMKGKKTEARTMLGEIVEKGIPLLPTWLLAKHHYTRLKGKRGH